MSGEYEGPTGEFPVIPHAQEIGDNKQFVRFNENFSRATSDAKRIAKGVENAIKRSEEASHDAAVPPQITTGNQHENLLAYLGRKGYPYQLWRSTDGHAVIVLNTRYINIIDRPDWSRGNGK